MVCMSGDDRKRVVRDISLDYCTVLISSNSATRDETRTSTIPAVARSAMRPVTRCGNCTLNAAAIAPPYIYQNGFVSTAES